MNQPNYIVTYMTRGAKEDIPLLKRRNGLIPRIGESIILRGPKFGKGGDNGITSFIVRDVIRLISSDESTEVVNVRLSPDDVDRVLWLPNCTCTERERTMDNVASPRAGDACNFCGLCVPEVR